MLPPAATRYLMASTPSGGSGCGSPRAAPASRRCSGAWPRSPAGWNGGLPPPTGHDPPQHPPPGHRPPPGTAGRSSRRPSRSPSSAASPRWPCSCSPARPWRSCWTGRPRTLGGCGPSAPPARRRCSRPGWRAVSRIGARRLAVAGAVAVSPLAPVGAVRVFDPARGVQADRWCSRAGAAVLTAALLAGLGVLTWRSVRPPGDLRGRQGIVGRRAAAPPACRRPRWWGPARRVEPGAAPAGSRCWPPWPDPSWRSPP